MVFCRCFTRNKVDDTKNEEPKKKEKKHEIERYDNVLLENLRCEEDKDIAKLWKLYESSDTNKEKEKMLNEILEIYLKKNEY